MSGEDKVAPWTIGTVDFGNIGLAFESVEQGLLLTLSDGDPYPRNDLLAIIPHEAANEMLRGLRKCLKGKGVMPIETVSRKISEESEDRLVTSIRFFDDDGDKGIEFGHEDGATTRIFVKKRSIRWLLHQLRAHMAARGIKVEREHESGGDILAVR